MYRFGKAKVPPWAKAVGPSEEMSDPPIAASIDPPTAAVVPVNQGNGLNNGNNLVDKAEKIR